MKKILFFALLAVASCTAPTTQLANMIYTIDFNGTSETVAVNPVPNSTTDAYLNIAMMSPTSTVTYIRSIDGNNKSVMLTMPNGLSVGTFTVTGYNQNTIAIHNDFFYAQTAATDILKIEITDYANGFASGSFDADMTEINGTAKANVKGSFKDLRVIQ